MNKENASKLWKIIQEAGDYLLGQWNVFGPTNVPKKSDVTLVHEKAFRDLGSEFFGLY